MIFRSSIVRRILNTCFSFEIHQAAEKEALLCAGQGLRGAGRYGRCSQAQGDDVHPRGGVQRRSPQARSVRPHRREWRECFSCDSNNYNGAVAYACVMVLAFLSVRCIFCAIKTKTPKCSLYLIRTVSNSLVFCSSSVSAPPHALRKGTRGIDAGNHADPWWWARAPDAHRRNGGQGPGGGCDHHHRQAHGERFIRVIIFCVPCPSPRWYSIHLHGLCWVQPTWTFLFFGCTSWVVVSFSSKIFQRVGQKNWLPLACAYLVCNCVSHVFCCLWYVYDQQLADGLDEDPIVIPSNDRLTALIGVLPLQLIAYELAVLKGINPDTPRNLAKVYQSWWLKRARTAHRTQAL